MLVIAIANYSLSLHTHTHTHMHTCMYAGEFGIVYKGYYIKTSADSEICAVKTLRGLAKTIPLSTPSNTQVDF